MTSPRDFFFISVPFLPKHGCSDGEVLFPGQLRAFGDALLRAGDISENAEDESDGGEQEIQKQNRSFMCRPSIDNRLAVQKVNEILDMKRSGQFQPEDDIQKDIAHLCEDHHGKFLPDANYIVTGILVPCHTKEDEQRGTSSKLHCQTEQQRPDRFVCGDKLDGD
ncbi:MAG: hypothetical protein IKZ41_00460, partial [Clostridia bacterium]|nr:hypothetical protein [Clostridia bacterium]